MPEADTQHFLLAANDVDRLFRYEDLACCFRSVGSRPWCY